MLSSINPRAYNEHIEPVSLPLRSRLYSLQPVGINTPYVECLTSYISRLAAAHTIDVRTLVIHEILTTFDNVYVENPKRIKLFWFSRSSVLNGLCTAATKWLHSLETLTMTSDLHVLTMLTWKHVISARMLLRRTQAWCPECYSEWNHSNQVIHMPLLWTLQPVTICIRHKLYLQERCPDSSCQARLPLLTANGRIGYCSKCQRWLGFHPHERQGTSNTIPQEDWAWQEWVTSAIGGLLESVLPISVLPKAERITTVISILARELARDSIRSLACHLALSNRDIQDLYLGRRILQIDTLLQICYRARITPRQFLIEDPATIEVTRPEMALPEVRRISRRTDKAFDVEQVQKLLGDCVLSDEVPPPSMAEVARRIGHDRSNLAERFPQLCKLISERYRTYRRIKRQSRIQEVVDEIREVMVQLDNQGIYPTHKQVMAHLQEASSTRPSEVSAARRMLLQELDWI